MVRWYAGILVFVVESVPVIMTVVVMVARVIMVMVEEW